MPRNVTRKLIESHLVDGQPEPGREIALRIDQTLTQDATGTLVMLALESMGLDRVKTELSAQYVDHNLVQEDFRNADDHLFLRSACQRFGAWYSPPGNGVSHPVHMQRFGRPGATMVGSDSHTCAAGSLGMLAIGAGGLDVAMCMAGEPLHIKMPNVVGVEVTGRLPDWVSAKDVILEMLRRYGVKGGKGRVFEYYGEGLAGLSAMDRHVIANMGQEMGHTTTVFPSDGEVRRFLEREGRGDVWQELVADAGAGYDEHCRLDLSELVPLIAKPSSPGNVVPVSEVAGEEIYQAYIGSSANPGFRDFAVPAAMVDGRRIKDWVSLDVNPTSRQLLEELMATGHLASLVQAGARLHQAGCNGCIGMGQAPATGRNSLRTVPRNFPGRSGTREDSVFLCSPETATASALRGMITDPRDLDQPCPAVREPDPPIADAAFVVAPPEAAESRRVELVKGPNIASLPDLEPIADEIRLPVVLKAGDDVSTDEILRAGAQVLPLRSNIPAISAYTFTILDETYPERASEVRDDGGHAVVGGHNYGQGSSREHAALAPRYLGLRLVVAKSFSRIHWQNLVNFGVLPVTFADESDYDRLEQGDVLHLAGIHAALSGGGELEAHPDSPRGGRKDPIRLHHDLSDRQKEVLLKGGLINWARDRV